MSFFISNGGSGGVAGPASATDSRVAAFDGPTGKLLKDGGKLVSDLVTGPASAVSGALAYFTDTSGKATDDADFKIVSGTNLFPNSDVTNRIGFTGSAMLAIYSDAFYFGSNGVQFMTKESGLNRVKLTTDYFGIGAQSVGGRYFSVIPNIGGAALTITNFRIRLDDAWITYAQTAGAQKRAGTVTLVAGTATVSSTSFLAGTKVFVSMKTPGGTLGNHYQVTVTAATGFTVTAIDLSGALVNTDTSTLEWFSMDTESI